MAQEYLEIHVSIDEVRWEKFKLLQPANSMQQGYQQNSAGLPVHMHLFQTYIPDMSPYPVPVVGLRLWSCGRLRCFRVHAMFRCVHPFGR